MDENRGVLWMTDEKYREFEEWFRAVEKELEEKHGGNYWHIFDLLKEAWSRGAASR